MPKKQERNENIFVDVSKYEDEHYPFQIFIGGRGTGKTFSALRHCVRQYLDKNEMFLYLRRKEGETEMLYDKPGRGEGLNPFKPLNRAYDWDIGFEQIQKKVGVVGARLRDEEGAVKGVGEVMGYSSSMLSISGVRGIDLSDCTRMVYDEFIPENHEKRVRGESTAFFNAIETINRNREFLAYGGKPILVYMLANSNQIDSDLLLGLNLTGELEKMTRKGKEHLYLPERGLAVHMLRNTAEFDNKKSKTALYKLAQGTDFYDMSLNNEFSFNDFSLVQRENVNQYRAVFTVDEFTVMVSKDGTRVYATYCPAGKKCPHFNLKHAQDIKALRRKYGLQLNDAYMNNRLFFENYAIKNRIVEQIL